MVKQPGAHSGVLQDVATLMPDLHAGLTIYVKGSRVNRLERVTAALAPGSAAAGGH